MRANQARYRTATMARMLGVSLSGFHAWRDCEPSRRRQYDDVLKVCKGSQYTSYAFGKRCREMGIVPSMGSVGDCYDNAMAESFFATLECELLDRRKFPTQAEARTAIFE